MKISNIFIKKEPPFNIDHLELDFKKDLHIYYFYNPKEKYPFTCSKKLIESLSLFKKVHLHNLEIENFYPVKGEMIFLSTASIHYHHTLRQIQAVEYNLKKYNVIEDMKYILDMRLIGISNEHGFFRFSIKNGQIKTSKDFKELDDYIREEY